MATSSRPNSGARDTLYSNLIERYVNGRNAEDLVFENTAGLAALKPFIKKSALPHDLSVRIKENRDESLVMPFEYYDEVPTSPIKGAQTPNFNPAQYSFPITLSHQEMIELMTPEAIADHMEFVYESAMLEISDVLGKDIYRGNINNSKRINGLENMLPDFAHFATDDNAVSDADGDPITRRWQTRKASGTSYGGITHVPWTASSAGTYWEGNSAEFFPAQTELGFDSNGAPTDSQKRFDEFYMICSWGLDNPKIIISTPEEYRQYESAVQTKQQVTRGPATVNGNISFDNIQYKNAMWVYDYYAQTYTAQNDAVVGNGNIYFINPRHLEFHVDSRWNFALSNERTPVNQHATTRHLLWRGTMFTKNPRMHGRFFDGGN